MENQRTLLLNGPHRGPQSSDRAKQQRVYRGRESDAFRTLVAALKEVELTNPRSRREILRKAAGCLRRLGEEQVNLQQQLTNNITWASIPQPEAQEYLSDDDRLLQVFLAQFEYPDDQAMYAGEPTMDVYGPEGDVIYLPWM